MDAAAFEQVYGAFQDFSRLLLCAVWALGDAGPQPSLSPGPLVQSGERRNAENLSETTPAMAPVVASHVPTIGRQIPLDLLVYHFLVRRGGFVRTQQTAPEDEKAPIPRSSPCGCGAGLH